MATAAIYSSPLLSSISPRTIKTRKVRSLITAAAKSQPSSDLRSEDIVVVVGAGIAALATALSLRRLGIRLLVLEQGESLRTGGTLLTLFKNGWRVLDAVGVADELRSTPRTREGLILLRLSVFRNAGFDPELFRVDPYGNVLYLYADSASPLAWDIDH